MTLRDDVGFTEFMTYVKTHGPGHIEGRLLVIDMILDLLAEEEDINFVPETREELLAVGIKGVWNGSTLRVLHDWRDEIPEFAGNALRFRLGHHVHTVTLAGLDRDGAVIG